MQTYFINVPKSHLRREALHQSWRAATTRSNMFCQLRNFLFCNSTIKTAMFRDMLSQICRHGSVVRAVRFLSERLPVLIQTARFCPSCTSVPTLFKSWETKPSPSSSHGGLPPRGQLCLHYSVQNWNACFLLIASVPQFLLNLFRQANLNAVVIAM